MKDNLHSGSEISVKHCCASLDMCAPKGFTYGLCHVLWHLQHLACIHFSIEVSTPMWTMFSRACITYSTSFKTRSCTYAALLHMCFIPAQYTLHFHCICTSSLLNKCCMLVYMSPSGCGAIRSSNSWRSKLLLRHEVDGWWEMKASPTEQVHQWSLSEAKSNRTPVALKQGGIVKHNWYLAWRYRRTSLRLFFSDMRSYIQGNMSESRGSESCGNNKAVRSESWYMQ